MKIRMLGNSIRLRLSQSDVQTLEEQGRVAERVHFPDGTILTYSINIQENESLTASFDNNEIKVFLAQSMASGWSTNTQVGYDSLLDIGAGTSLKILVEKDFKCLTDRGEDERDLYKNPLEKH